MNFLAHLYLADRTGTSMTGAILGDFVRGSLDGRLAPDLETGIRLHRHVDRFTDDHPVVADARARLPRPFRRYAGILLDVYFDHLLADQWRQFHAQPLAQFAATARDALVSDWPHEAVPAPPAGLHGFDRLLVSYGEAAGIQYALERLDQRLRRPSPLARALPLLQAQHDRLAADFAVFFPALVVRSRQWLRAPAT